MQISTSPERKELQIVELAGSSVIKVAELLKILADKAGPALEAISESAAVIKPGEGKWSKKEIIGHLVDSAANNHQRFVRALIEPELHFPSYDQELWVRSQAYQHMEWGQLIELWRYYNLMVAHVVKQIPEVSFNTQCWIGAAKPVPLVYLVRDYLRHVTHHLSQVLPELLILQLPADFISSS